MRNCKPRLWSDYFSRVKADSQGRASFYVKGSRSWLFQYDGYMGGYKSLDEIISLCEAMRFKLTASGHDSPMNVSDRERYYEFLDGGFEVVEGNYFYGDKSQGAYIRGFRAFRWILFRLEISQPRKLKGESSKPGFEDLCRELDANVISLFDRSKQKTEG